MRIWSNFLKMSLKENFILLININNVYSNSDSCMQVFEMFKLFFRFLVNNCFSVQKNYWNNNQSCVCTWLTTVFNIIFKRIHPSNIS